MIIIQKFKEFTYWDLSDKLRYYWHWCKEPTGIVRFLEFFERIPFLNLAILFIKPFYVLFEYMFKLQLTVIMFALIFSPFIVPFIFVRFGLRKTFSNDYISYGIAIGLSFIIGALLYYVKGLYIRSRANFRKTSSLYFVVLLVLTCGLPTFLGFYGISRSVWDSQLEVYWQYLIILVVTLLVGVVSYLFYEPNKGTSLWIYNWAFNLGFNRSFFEH